MRVRNSTPDFYASSWRRLPIDLQDTPAPPNKTLDMPRTSTLAATVALASAHMPGEYHPPGAEHGQLERFIEWLPWSSLGRMPPADGARWYADPQTVSNLFLAIIAVLMIFQHVDFFLHFRERRFGPLVRESPLHLRRRSRALVRGLRRRLPRRQPRQPIVFSRARATLDAKLSTMVGLGEVKAHLSNMLDTLEMDARRCAQMPGFVTQRGCMHMVFLGNPGTGKTAVAELVAVLLKEMGLLRRGHLVRVRVRVRFRVKVRVRVRFTMLGSGLG